MSIHITHEPAGAACSHCDTSVPHEHLDVPAIVARSRGGAVRRAVGMIAGSAAVLVAAPVLGRLLDNEGVPVGAATLTALGWAVATLAGLAVLGAAGSRTTPRSAVVLAGLTTAALIPVAALAVAAYTGGSWPAALTAGGAWLLSGAVAEVGHARTWRRLLLTEGPAGEQARSEAVARRGAAPSEGTVGRWAAQGAFVAMSVWLLGLHALVVVVLVPLAVALAALATGRTRTR